MAGYRFTVTVERHDRDQYGAPVDPPATHEVGGCYDEPVTASEAAAAFVSTTITRSLSAPPRADIRADDTLVYPDGTRWHVVGDPYDWSNPHVRHRPALEVMLERTH